MGPADFFGGVVREVRGGWLEEGGKGGAERDFKKQPNVVAFAINPLISLILRYFF